MSMLKIQCKWKKTKQKANTSYSIVYGFSKPFQQQQQQKKNKRSQTSASVELTQPKVSTKVPILLKNS